MKITYDWLKDHLKISVKENKLLEKLTDIGLEVESIENLSEGLDLFHQYCAVCHGPGSGTSGPVANLFYADQSVHDIWDAIVVGGAYTQKGMPNFKHALDSQKSQAIRAYISQLV